MSTEVIVAIIVSITSVATTIILYMQQRNKDNATQSAQDAQLRNEREKYNSQYQLELEKLQAELSKNLWSNIQTELDDERAKRLELTAEFQKEKEARRDLQKELGDLENTVERERNLRRSLEEAVANFRIGVLILVSQLQEAGIQPKWYPPNLHRPEEDTSKT